MLHNEHDLRRHLLPDSTDPVTDSHEPDAATVRDTRRDFARDLDAVLEGLRAMLIEKNLAYGDSALNPLRLFSEADPLEQLRVRIDDKVSRIRRGRAGSEDAVEDWLGYLILLKIAQHRRDARDTASGLAEVPL